MRKKSQRKKFSFFFNDIKKDMNGSKFKVRDYQLKIDNKYVKLDDRHFFPLMILLAEGKASLRDLERKVIIFTSQFGFSSFFFSSSMPKKRRMKRHKEAFDVEKGCKELLKANKIKVGEKGYYFLTEKGEILAKLCKEEMEKGAYYAGRALDYFLNPQNAVKVTVFVDFFLALIKIASALLTKSLALMADGTDAAIDTFSAIVVWLGVRSKKEFLGTLVIIFMMFFTFASIGFKSVSALLGAFGGKLEPILNPQLVIIIELIALIAAVFLYFYQHYVGKKNGSLSLISQSVDSKNHILVSGTIITGAVFSMIGVYFLDSLIGAFIAVRIFMDAFELSKEVFSKARGEETDFSKYSTVIDGKWSSYKLESFQNWILYSLHKENIKTKDEILSSLNRTFKPEYIPIVSEFNFGIGKDFDFHKNFDNLIQPLINKGFIKKEGGSFFLTDSGRERINSMVKALHYVSNF